VVDVLDALDIRTATLAFSCANGFYASRVAQLAPQRVASLFLAQTPSLAAMHAWTRRIIPRPLRIPVAGQLAAWLFRRKAALAWYDVALPKGIDREPFRKPTRHALSCGSCFCLAGVVQGLVRESVTAIKVSDTPCTMIWGAKDRSHRGTNALSLRDCIPHAEIVEFDDCGHFPDLEQPERYAALLTAHMIKYGKSSVAVDADALQEAGL